MAVICESCNNGYHLAQDDENTLCFKKEIIDNGFCITINNIRICYCMSGFIGNACEICEFTLMDNKCY